MYDNEFENEFNQKLNNQLNDMLNGENHDTHPDVQDTSSEPEKTEPEKIPDQTAPDGAAEIPPEVFEMRSEVPLEDVSEPEPEPEPEPGPERASETAEIVYDTDKKGAYSCNFVENAPRETENKKSKKGTSSNWMKVAALIIAALFTLTFMAYVGLSFAEEFFDDRDIIKFEDGKITGKNDIFQMESPNRVEPAEKKPGSNGQPSSGQLTVGEIAEKCKKSSVGILIEKETYYFGMVYKSSGVGSGFILSEDGYIATNNHVVDGASKVTVMLDNGERYDAVVVGKDAITDIAVVKIDATGLPVMERGNSDDVMVGDVAVAIGTPASIELAGTVTDGIISAVDRKIDITDDYGNVIKTMTLIQTNATINPGNSGGPLINSRGQVIGINTLKLTAQYEGIGFAIPINGAIDIMNQLIADGKVSDRGTALVTGAPSIGISCADITDAEAEYYGIPKGVLVIQINKSSQASHAGLRRGDIILEFEGEKVETSDEINVIKDRYKPDDVVTMKVYRDGEGELEITFKLDIKQ